MELDEEFGKEGEKRREFQRVSKNDGDPGIKGKRYLYIYIEIAGSSIGHVSSVRLSRYFFQN